MKSSMQRPLHHNKCRLGTLDWSSFSAKNRTVTSVASLWQTTSIGTSIRVTIATVQVIKVYIVVVDRNAMFEPNESDF